MSRLEYKYLVPVEQLSQLRDALSPFVETDAYTPEMAKEYTVHSLYFDTLSLDYYYQKLAGIQHRLKIRARGYNTETKDSIVFLEIKRKDDIYVSKNRACIFYKHIRDIFVSSDKKQYVRNGDGTPHAIDNARKFFYHMYRYSLRPTILIHYGREAFFQKFNKSFRITLDKNIRSTPFPGLEDLYSEGRTEPSLLGFFVLEVKFNRDVEFLPKWLTSILDNFNLKKTSVSKYTISLDTHGIPIQSDKHSILAFSHGYHFKSRN
ncbi:MAG: polyphosphate polymerase domain-containing protein [Candidatus Latescibacteria bacterium]|nr:polyphosphate polymerase domain-containing protein [Candidatus Latescibacterota bacterium]